MGNQSFDLGYQQLNSEYPNADLDDVRKQAKAYLNSLFAKGWLTDRQMVVTGEGGWDSMVYQAVIYELAGGGFKEYGNFLTSGYVERFNEEPLDEALGYEEPVYVETQDGKPSDGLIERLGSNGKGGRPAKALSKIELDFLDDFAHTATFRADIGRSVNKNCVRDSAGRVGLDYEQAHRLVENLRRQADGI